MSKNKKLSAEAKDKIKTDLARCRNSQKEVFVKDYDNWMKYESQVVEKLFGAGGERGAEHELHGKRDV